MKRIFINAQGEVRNGWKILGFIAITWASAVGLHFCSKPIMPFLKAHTNLIPGPFLSALVLLIPTAICLKLERAPLRSVGLDLNVRWLREATLGTALGVGLMLVTALVILALGGFHWERNAAGSLRVLLGGAWIFLGVAVFEELAFRGYLFQRIVRGIGKWPAQLLMAGLFALAHWQNPGMEGGTRIWASLNIALAAILLGLALLKTQSLALPVGIHLGWNWAQGSLLGFGVSGTRGQGFLSPVFHHRPEWLTGGNFGPEASVPSIIILGAACIWLAMRKTAPTAAE